MKNVRLLKNNVELFESVINVYVIGCLIELNFM